MSVRAADLSVEADPAKLGEIAEFVSACCQRWRIDEEQAFGIQLAVDEACTNVIEHAYKTTEGEIEIHCWIEGHDFWVKIDDRGQAFDPSTIADPDLTASLEDRRVGGLGIYLMRQLMDEVRYSFGEEGNSLEMVKRDAAP